MISSDTMIINIAIEVFSSVLCFVLILCMLVAGNLRQGTNRAFMAVLLSNIAVMLSDALAFASIGKVEPHNFILNYIGNVCTYIFSYVVIMTFSNYLVSYLSTKIKMKRTAVYAVYVVCGFAIILTFISLWNGMYFYIDENNIYYRRDLYWLSQILGVFGLLINMGVIVRYRKQFNRLESFVLATYIVLPVIAVIIQMLIYGLVSVYIASTITILLIYVGIQGEQAKQIKEKELELTESRVAMMISQIHPHFLYNSLVAIQELCLIDPATASQTVSEFSRYLRGNLDSLTNANPIPFTKELKHVENYLALEKKRFGDKLQVNYDISACKFYLPALTLQPIAENAVRHGVTKREEGGTVTISTAETETNYLITVMDNGVGFDPNQPKQDERTHVGIKNVRGRLDSMCSGTLSVTSRPDFGTTALITIPKGEIRR